MPATTDPPRKKKQQQQQQQVVSATTKPPKKKSSWIRPCRACWVASLSGRGPEAVVGSKRSRAVLAIEGGGGGHAELTVGEGGSTDWGRGGPC